MKVREVIRLLKQNGWQQVVQRGSHRQFRHPTKPGRVTVTGRPSKELAPAGEHPAPIRSVEGDPLSTWTVVYEQTATGWSAFVPALPGVAAAGDTREETEQLIGEAIALHVHGLAEDGLPIPDPDSVAVGQVELRQPA